MTATVIGLGGRLRAGKDEVALHLERKYGFARIGMSDALHEAMLALDPLIYVCAHRLNFPHDVEMETFTYSEAIAEYGYVGTKEMFPEARRLLQRLGTEVGRNMIGENTWTNITARKIEQHLKDDRPVALTGLRFSNELTMIRQFAGRALWVERPGLDSGTPASTHASENGVTASDFDKVLLNNGTIEDLHRAVDRLMEGLS